MKNFNTWLSNRELTENKDQLETVEMHPCKGCNRPMAGPAPYCLFCASKLNKQGLCAKCAERPVKSNRSKYCKECSEELYRIKMNNDLERDVRPEFIPKYRGPDSRENRGETKFG